ncbi:thiamine ABC transporter substrate-binding protein [Nocardioides bigeumensis]|uniref:thiamine ABC transporter substrate-binding protein n=1 Tax=Nocardioides bigeumensis TaxID=433657 RepID=UPI0031DA3007
MRRILRRAHRPGTRTITTLVLVTAVTVLAGCSLVGEGDDEPATSPGGSSASPGQEAPREVVLVTHDSFALPKKLVKAFEADSGYELEVRASGDAGALTNKLVLTQDSPTGDVAYGVDNSFASRALDAGVFADSGVTLPDGAADYTLDDGTDRLVPIDTGAVCVNVDTRWFEEQGIPEPETLDDLVEPAYADLFVTPGAATSSPGMAFLLATIAEHGDDWPDYWADLMANGAKLTSGWSDAYYVDFTQGGGDGDRPIVLSYDSSPAFTLTEDGEATTTRALLDTCFRQVEYAGVLAGAANPDGARAVIEWLLSPEVQAALPESMYVFPVVSGVELPEDWARFAEQPTDAYTVDADEITANREQWLTEWTDITSR